MTPTFRSGCLSWLLTFGLGGLSLLVGVGVGMALPAPAARVLAVLVVLAASVALYFRRRSTPATWSRFAIRMASCAVAAACGLTLGGAASTASVALERELDAGLRAAMEARDFEKAADFYERYKARFGDSASTREARQALEPVFARREEQEAAADQRREEFKRKAEAERDVLKERKAASDMEDWIESQLEKQTPAIRYVDAGIQCETSDQCSLALNYENEGSIRVKNLAPHSVETLCNVLWRIAARYPQITQIRVTADGLIAEDWSVPPFTRDWHIVAEGVVPEDVFQGNVLICNSPRAFLERLQAGSERVQLNSWLEKHLGLR